MFRILAIGLISFTLIQEAAAEHPLIGKIWSVNEARFAEMDELLGAASEAHWLMLGETHDNPTHHMLQAGLLAARAETGRPAVVWEMAERHQQDILDDPDLTPATIGAALDWEERGWPDFAMYRPIFEAAEGLPMLAGNLDRRNLMRMGAEGLDALPDTLVRLMDLPVLSPEEQKPWVEEIVSAHCDMMPASAAGPMVDIQRARDGSMAVAMIAGDEISGDGAVLIAGSMHVRETVGVPEHLSRLVPGAEALTIAGIEVSDGFEDPGDYAPLPFDYVIFTERAEREDPCEQFRRHMERKRGN